MKLVQPDTPDSPSFENSGKLIENPRVPSSILGLGTKNIKGL
jgi:hypothetical protein